MTIDIHNLLSMYPSDETVEYVYESTNNNNNNNVGYWTQVVRNSTCTFLKAWACGHTKFAYFFKLSLVITLSHDHTIFSLASTFN